MSAIVTIAAVAVLLLAAALPALCAAIVASRSDEP